MEEIQQLANELYVQKLKPFVQEPLGEAERNPFVGLSYLTFKTHQLIAKYIFTSLSLFYPRALIEYATGSGKTLTFLLVAQFWTKKNIELVNEGMKPHNIYVITFNQKVVKREFLRYPELGVITRREQRILREYEERARRGNADAVKTYKEYKQNILRRITNPELGGFFKFFGYKEFSNRLFGDKINLETYDMAKIHEAIANGTILVNQSLLKATEDSLIFCDEIHNTYNVDNPNRYGLAIQYVLDYHKRRCIAIFLSATPANSSAQEFVDLDNLLSIEEKYNKSDYFKDGKLIPAKLDELGSHAAGRLLYLPASGQSFPTKVRCGEDIPDIKYLKFTKCKMPPIHERTYTTFINTADKSTDDSAIPSDGKLINDMVYPNPESDEVGLFRSHDAKAAIRTASAEWRKRAGVELRTVGADMVIGGPYLKMPELARWSSKYPELLRILADIRANKRGRTIVYHHWVVNGVYNINEVLINNGYIDQYMEPANDTLCYNCGNAKGAHKSTKGCEFLPIRFATIHNKKDTNEKEAILDTFLSSNNIYGQQMMILVGSKVIKESIDFSGIQNQIVVFMPDNISTLIQFEGRGCRDGANMMLDPKDRDIHLYNLMNWSDKFETHEYQRYRAKMRDYLDIQEVSKVRHQYAINNFLHYENIKKYIKTDTLENLLYEPKYMPTPTGVNSVRFYASGYAMEEVVYLRSVIKRLFMLSPFYTYEELWAAAQRPQFPTETDPKQYNEDLFAIALSSLVSEGSSETVSEYSFPEDFLFSDSLKTILIKGQQYKITQEGKYYVILKYVNGHVLRDINSFNTDTTLKTDEIIPIPMHYNHEESFRTKYLQIARNPFDKYDFLVMNAPSFHYMLAEKYIADTLVDEMPYLKEIVALYRAIGFIDGSKRYIMGNRAKVFTRSIWREEAHIAKQITENEHVVGYSDAGKFKLRRPVQYIEVTKDRRKMERGIECMSKRKREVMDVINKLGLEVDSSRIKNTCRFLMTYLIDAEIENIASGKRRLKYFYFFFEQQPRKLNM